MEASEGLVFVENLLVQRQLRRLDDLERRVFVLAWENQDYEELAIATGLRTDNLKCNVSPKVWRLLTNLFGEKITKKNLRRLVEAKVSQLQGVTQKTKLAEAKIVWNGCPPSRSFYGRETEVKALAEAIITNRVILLYGFAGTGKTALASEIYRQVNRYQFNHAIWKSFHPTFSTLKLAKEVVAAFEQSSESANPILDLVEALETHPSFVVLDQIEQVREQALMSFLSAIAMGQSQSVIILTSRERVPEILALERKGYPVKSIQVKGLSQEDAACILRANHLSDENTWEQLISLYSGNPFMLEIVSNLIIEMFSGKVSDFLNTLTLWLGDIYEMTLNEVFSPRRITQTQRKILKILAQIKAEEAGLSLKQILERMQSEGVSSTDILSALNVLANNSMVEKLQTPALFRLQPVIQKYVLKDPQRYFQDSSIIAA